jgi:hypothetical protein
MLNGAHVVLYSSDAEADRAFFRDVLNLHHADAGHEQPWGWLTEITLPSGAKLGVYQPKHARPERA